MSPKTDVGRSRLPGERACQSRPRSLTREDPEADDVAVVTYLSQMVKVALVEHHSCQRNEMILLAPLSILLNASKVC